MRPSQNMIVLVAGLSRGARGLSTRPSIASLASNLQNPSINLPQLQENGSKATATFSVYNPAEPTTVLANVSKQGRAEARTAIQLAEQALPSWRDGTTAQERSRYLIEWSRLIQQNSEYLATVMTLESGKPLAESRGEVAYGASFLDHFAAEALRSGGPGGGFLVPTTFKNCATGEPRGHIMAIQQAVGVCSLISPWNFPLAMITRKAGPALAAGCTAVIKPSELTPLTAIALQSLAYQAGIPMDVLHFVTADKETTPDVGHEFCTNPSVRKVSFTGSTAVGKTLMSWSSQTVQRLSLELGGNAPFVVFDDADLELAATAAIASKFRNAGQTCVCADRFLIQESVHDAFVDIFTKKVKELKVGNGMDPDITVGPLITVEAAKRVDAKVQQAIKDGATCVVGGSYLGASVVSQFYNPTVLTNVSHESDVWKTETFGPLAAIRSFRTEAEALELANNSRLGLASYFCTKDLSRAFRFAERLDCGLVGVNDGIISTCAAPFGGVKESGLGREGGSLGLAEYLETKYVFMNT